MKRFLKFWGSVGAEGADTLMNKSVELVANLAPGMVSAAQLRMLEDELREHEKNLAEAKIAFKEDQEENRRVTEKFQKAQQAMNVLKQQVEEAKTAQDEQKLARLMQTATKARSEYDKIKAEYDKEMADDELIQRRMDAAQRVYDAYKTKIDEIRTFNEQKQNELATAKDERKLADMEAEVAAMEANALGAINSLHTLNVAGSAFDKAVKKEQIKTEEAKLRTERMSAATSTGTLDSILSQQAATSTANDPFAGL